MKESVVFGISLIRESGSKKLAGIGHFDFWNIHIHMDKFCDMRKDALDVQLYYDYYLNYLETLLLMTLFLSNLNVVILSAPFFTLPRP